MEPTRSGSRQYSVVPGPKPGHDENQVLLNRLDQWRVRATLTVWCGRRIIVAAMAALLLLPVAAGHAGVLDFFKRSAKPDKPPKHATEPKRPAAAKPAASPKPDAAKRAHPSASNRSAAAP